MRVLTLDDMEVRQAAFRRWFAGHDLVQARTAQEAIAALRTGPRFQLVQLDHDLAEEHYLALSEGLSEDRAEAEAECLAGTGMDVVEFILTMEKPLACPEHVIVHSWNIARGTEMARRLADGGVWVRQHRFDPNVCSVSLSF